MHGKRMNGYKSHVDHCGLPTRATAGGNSPTKRIFRVLTVVNSHPSTYLSFALQYYSISVGIFSTRESTLG